MKSSHLALSFIFASLLTIYSCKKQSAVSDVSQTAIQAAAVQTQAIAIAPGSTTQGDSIYLVHTCGNGQVRTAINATALPATVNTYLTTNYAGYTFVKAFTVANSSGTLQGYVVAIQYNGNPVGLKFDASGNFVQVLEQREGRDLEGEGWHGGGCFDNRDGRHRDTLTLSALPSAIQLYFTTNYPQDTLLRASITKKNSYIVLSKNNGIYASLFDSAGNFIRRELLPSHPGRINAVDQSALPAAAQSYLSITYPAYVFDRAFVITSNTTVLGYCVIIDANNTKYAVQFDAAGNFVKVKTL